MIIIILVFFQLSESQFISPTDDGPTIHPPNQLAWLKQVNLDSHCIHWVFTGFGPSTVSSCKKSPEDKARHRPRRRDRVSRAFLLVGLRGGIFRAKAAEGKKKKRCGSISIQRIH